MSEKMEETQTLRELKDLTIEAITKDASDIATDIAISLRRNILSNATHYSSHFPLMVDLGLITGGKFAHVTGKGKEFYERLEAEGFYDSEEAKEFY